MVKGLTCWQHAVAAAAVVVSWPTATVLHIWPTHILEQVDYSCGKFPSTLQAHVQGTAGQLSDRVLHK